MENLQNDMKKYCDDSDATEIKIKGRYGNLLPHHDMMLPHWQKLFKALHGRTSINSLSIIGISLPVSVLDIMFPTLQTINLEQMLLLDVQSIRV